MLEVCKVVFPWLQVPHLLPSPPVCFHHSYQSRHCLHWTEAWSSRKQWRNLTKEASPIPQKNFTSIFNNLDKSVAAASHQRGMSKAPELGHDVFRV